jgi:hypothetical protein
MRRAIRSVAAAAGLSLLLSACAATIVEQPSAPVAKPRPIVSAVGLESVIGRNARALETQFGKPDLDVREGSARKLQFSSAICVLDAYLYPPRSGADAVVTYVDARLPDGRDIDRASCVAALNRQGRAR